MLEEAQASFNTKIGTRNWTPYLYTEAKSVANWIQKTFGIAYTPQGVVDLLNRIGFTYKKTTEVPCEADATKQVAFAEELSALLKEKDTHL